MVDDIKKNGKYHKPPISTKENLEIGAQITIVKPQVNDAQISSQHLNIDCDDDLSEYGCILLKCMKNSGTNIFTIQEESFYRSLKDDYTDYTLVAKGRLFAGSQCINSDEHLQEDIEELCKQGYLRQGGGEII